MNGAIHFKRSSAERKKIPLLSCSGSVSSINRNKTKQTKTTHHEKGISVVQWVIKICLFLISIKNKCNQGKGWPFQS